MEDLALFYLMSPIGEFLNNMEISGIFGQFLQVLEKHILSDIWCFF